jgi:replicative DNA helicase
MTHETKTNTSNTNTPNTLPNSKESEMMALGCMLNDTVSLKIGSESLNDSDFYYSEHKIIFQVIKSAFKDEKPADIHLICEELRQQNKLKYVGDIVYITTLAQYAGTSAHLEAYCEDLKKFTMKRELISLSATLIKDVNRNISVNKLIEKLKENIKKIESKAEPETPLNFLLENNSELKLIEELKKTCASVSTGFTIGEEEVKIPGGAISVVAMPTGQGKTTTLINYSLGVLNHHHDKSVYFFTYEESAASIQTLFINTYINMEISKNNRESIKSYFRGEIKYIPEKDYDDFIRSKKAFFENLTDKGRLKIFYSSMFVEELISSIYFIKKHTNVGLVCIDYIQLLNLLHGRSSNRQEDLKTICHMLKNCAVETGLPILLGAQFNRTVVSEADLSPVAIREAADIEQIANLMIGGWNRNFTGFSRNGNVGRDGKAVAKEPAIYFEIMKGRGIKHGQSSIQDFNGNIGKISNRISSSKRGF